MRRTVLLLSLLALVAACANRPGPDGFQALGSPPIEVRLLPPQGGLLRFLTSEPAYVTVFEVAPDRGISLLYPQYGEQQERVTRTGANVEFLPWRVQGRMFYASTPYYSAFATLNRPTYLYIIASRSPLRTENIRLSPASLRSAMGWRSFLASDLSGTLDDLERLVVGDIADEEWSSDLYVIWPEMPLDQPWATRYAFFNCPDGRTVVLPLGWNVEACPGTRNLAQATRPQPPETDPADPPGTLPETDSTGTPVKRQPQPGNTNPHQPLPPATVGALPSDRATIVRPPVEGAAPSRPASPRADASQRKIETEPAPRAEPRPVSQPRSEPQPAPSRADPRPAPAEPRPAAEPKNPATP